MNSNLMDWDIEIKRFTNFSLEDTDISGEMNRVSIFSNQKKK